MLSKSHPATFTQQYPAILTALEAAAENAAGTGGHPLIGQCRGAEVGLLPHQDGEDAPAQTLVRIKLRLTQSEIKQPQYFGVFSVKLHTYLLQ